MADNQETETEATPAVALTKKETATPVASVEPRFAKEQFQDSQQFTQIEKDTLNVLLEDGQDYTIGEAKRVLTEWLKKEVK
ncbi:hypothetical protein QYF52_25790 [Paenibacillus polymyxa]|uniref:hypothetical protein n=1 Tax=Paenibacillus polymyxa TaxID=1406 RepID=UPI0025B66E27|nr:hypothetical protein [Paenibacillus polymyxa]MDN4081329.1 hypothetical protein [Paenibacillus polymyxa]MDN4085968.1 hypothetical protein [Paenibacillus polymyxa]MDN4111870.1 hypothetical protein [Paenibacillus polymyxa]